MFIKNSFVNEIISSFETNLKNFGQKERLDKNSEAVQNLLKAASLFEEAGLISQANEITSILEGLVSKAWELPEPEKDNELKDLKDLSSKDMEKNLKEKGWAFNADDDLVVGEDLPDDYEACGTCGYDHSYDGGYPGIAEKILKIHLDAEDVVGDEREKLMEKVFGPYAKQQAKQWQDEDKKRLGLEWWDELGKE